jgi:hypothetical protein
MQEEIKEYDHQVPMYDAIKLNDGCRWRLRAAYGLKSTATICRDSIGHRRINILFGPSASYQITHWVHGLTWQLRVHTSNGPRAERSSPALTRHAQNNIREVDDGGHLSAPDAHFTFY